MGKRALDRNPTGQPESSNQQPLLPALSTKLDAGGSHSKSKGRELGKDKKDKLLITGDDILIEYVARLMIAVKSIKENMLKA